MNFAGQKDTLGTESKHLPTQIAAAGKKFPVYIDWIVDGSFAILSILDAVVSCPKKELPPTNEQLLLPKERQN